jgi:hypothetical protein
MVSLLLCVAAVVLWVRTYSYTTHALNRMWLAPDRLESGTWSASTSGGLMKIWRLEKQWADRASYDERSVQWDGQGWSFDGMDFSFTPAAAPGFWERAGFTLRSQSNGFGSFQQRASGMTLPLWFVVLLTTLLPALGIVRSIRRWREATKTRGVVCATCGYDLRATPERCPECGAVPIMPEAKVAGPAGETPG